MKRILWVTMLCVVAAPAAYGLESGEAELSRHRTRAEKHLQAGRLRPALNRFRFLREELDRQIARAQEAERNDRAEALMRRAAALDRQMSAIQNKLTAESPRLRRALEQKVSLRFEETPLEECLQYLAASVDVRIRPGPGVSEAPPITFHVNDMKLELALDWLARLSVLTWKPMDDYIWFGAIEAIPEDEPKTAEPEGITDMPGEAALEVRFADGVTVRLSDAAMATQPRMTRWLLDAAHDPARDGRLVYQVPAGEQIRLQSIVAELDDGVRVRYLMQARLLIIDGPADALRRTAAVMRALGKYRVPPL